MVIPQELTGKILRNVPNPRIFTSTKVRHSDSGKSIYDRNNVLAKVGFIFLRSYKSKVHCYWSARTWWELIHQNQSRGFQLWDFAQDPFPWDAARYLYESPPPHGPRYRAALPTASNMLGGMPLHCWVSCHTAEGLLGISVFLDWSWMLVLLSNVRWPPLYVALTGILPKSEFLHWFLVLNTSVNKGGGITFLF